MIISVFLQLFVLFLCFSCFQAVASTGNGTACDESGGGGHELFGALDHLPVDIATLSMLIIVFGVLLVEMAFHYLGHVTSDTPFESMIHSIEKELMIVGTMAFTFKIILSTTHFFPTEWVVALEFADLLVPITSFLFCLQALLLIIMSVKQCDLWSKAYHLYLDELLTEFYDKQLQFRRRIFWLPLSFINDAMEFRIFHVIFCDANKITKRGFEFDEYVQRVFEKLLLDTLKIEIFDWILICIICSINWGRHALHLNFITCDHDSDDLHEVHACEAENSMLLFTLMGFVLLSIVIFLCCFSRIFQLRLFRACGIAKTIDYAQFLVNAEKRINGLKQPTDAEVQKIINKTKEMLSKHIGNSDHGSDGHGGNGKKSLRTSCDRMIGYIFNSITSFFTSIINFRIEDCGKLQLPKVDKLAIIQASILKRKNSTLDKSNDFSDSQKTKIKDGSSRTLTSEEIHSVYWFSNPEVYFDLVEVVTMMIAFYNALWVVNFSNTAVLTHYPKFWSLISILPGFLSFFLFVYVIKCSSILSAITSIDGNVLDETIEQSEDARNLGLGLRAKIIDKLNERSGEKNPEDSLKDLFDEIDENNSQLLSRSEFQIFLNALEISFSRSKWRIIFREIDRNFDDEISFDEMFLFLFPEHENSKAEEKRRLKLSGKSVKASAKKLENAMNSSSKYPGTIDNNYKLPVFNKQDSVMSFDSDNKNNSSRIFETSNSFSSDEEVQSGRNSHGKIQITPTKLYKSSHIEENGYEDLEDF